ncbi:UNVERIFIED_CONTAM: hypothetical protein FKN15_021085 [Acipenser sinensis]
MFLPVLNKSQVSSHQEVYHSSHPEANGRSLQVGNTVLIVFVSFFGSRVHRPRFIGIGALIASLAGFLMASAHLITSPYEYDHSIASLLFAITTTGPALAFMLGSAMLRFYVDIDKVSRGFPRILLRTLRSPIFLLVVLAEVNLSAMVAGLATFMAKFLERQFTVTASFANLLIGKQLGRINLYINYAIAKGPQQNWGPRKVVSFGTFYKNCMWSAGPKITGREAHRSLLSVFFSL